LPHVSSRARRSAPDLADPGELPLLRGEALLGRALHRLVIAFAAWLVAGALLCGVLALLGLWQPLVALPLLAVLGAGALWVAALVPSRPLPVWAALALVTVAVGATAWAGLTHSEQVLPRRDAGSYLQSAIDLAQGHRRPIAVPAASVGGPEALAVEGVTLASPAFYEVGSDTDPAIQPQFPVGASAWYSVAWWAGGASAAFWAPAVVGGMGILAIGLLASAVVGARWSPLAALTCALCFPLLHVNRSTYSEPLAVVVLAAALLALVQSARSARAAQAARARSAAVVAGALVGGGVLVRVDSLREVVLLLPVAALAAAQRQPHARALAASALGSAIVGGAVTWLTSSEYLRDIAGSLLPLLALGAVVGLGCAAALAWRRRGGALPVLVQAWLPRIAAAVVTAFGLALASRPWWQTTRQSPRDPGARVVAGLQLRQGLPVDGGRTYAEDTLVWMAWWVGPAALVIALAVAAALAHRLATAWVDGRALPPWSGPLLVAVGSSVLTWYRPGITPDHPWADRRLVIALPFVVLLVVAAAAALTRWSTRRLPFPMLLATSAGASLAVVLPTALATWPHATERVERGELAAVEQVCRSFSDGDLALMVDSRAANEWPQVLRGQCGVPALSTTAALRRSPAALESAVGQVSAAAQAHGLRLVVLGAESDEALHAVGAARIHQVLDTTVLEDQRLLEARPDGLDELPLRVWVGTAR
jgi:hypothetical protein